MALAAPSLSRTETHLWDGVLNIRKEACWTSHDVVARLRTRLKGGKVGHAGTLDPAATGVLPILIGKATRIAEYLLTWDKQYLVELRLGESTDTQDATGTVTAQRSVSQLNDQSVREAVAQFEGRISQLPPMYSAVKVNGVPLYKAARVGREVERQVREVTVDRIDVLRLQIPDVTLRVVCSKGTYMRTLCADIGESLGVGGHMRALERERVGPLTVARALTVHEAETRAASGTLGEVLLTLDSALREFPACMVNADVARRVIHGAPVCGRDVQAWEPAFPSDLFDAGRAIRVKDHQGRLLAIGTIRQQGEAGAADKLIVPSKVLATDRDGTVGKVIQ
ncbi:MAG TPA: tRNA pseudouridine(55) synthase TruB [Nitrospiraceae bacterium]|nr:tRNA pseudouridine(55) synthase TruB [Nitrospiraceae bacterium]